MTKHFTHLHLHTDYSLLDGAITINRLIDFGKKHNLKALAITDHGNIFGAVKFFQQCKKAGIKPILGMEAYFTPDVTVKLVEKKYHHLILIVQNEIGYRNLCKLIAFSYQQGFYFKPRIDYAILEKYSEGLIASSACLGGHIPSLLMEDNEQLVENRIDWFMSVFGKDKFYFEIQPEYQEEQKILNTKLYAWSQKKNIPLLATGDCHYLLPEDHEAHEVMLSIQTQHKLTDPDRFSFGSCRAYVKTQEEMLEIFKEHPDAVWNSGSIADRCEFDFKTGTLFFPSYAIPPEHTPESYFRNLSEQGLEKLLANGRIEQDQKQKYQERLNIEIDLIIKMGFVGYFLVVGDFIQWARRHHIPVGPGRGSAAGSLVAWSLEITNIDPLKYNLLFERFLNPERISMPDIDIDFCIEGREKVIQYIRDKYGHDNVGQIITFGTMMAKGVVKDVARVLSFPFEDANAITNLIPDQLKISLHEAIDQEPRLKELIASNQKVTKLFDIAFKLEGITRHASKHAAGIVISPEPIHEVLPVYVPSKSTELVTQYAMTELESIGFLKIDLLGLKNLTLIKKAITLIKKNHHIELDMDRLPLDDQKTFDLLCAGKTSGVFQLESEGIKDVLRKLHPEKFEDIIAVNALYRPGPLSSGMVDDFIERRHGHQKISYLFKELEPLLQETYGVIVYQEQVMKIASAIAGYSLGEADILRKAMGKKKIEVMAEQREIFIKRSIERKFDEKKAGELFDLMAYFAGYGFNKSHSAAYALIAYQTAYLKAHYPIEFMACLISLEATHPDKMVFYLQEVKEMNLTIVPPDINRSELDFTVIEGTLLFGLKGIKNVGDTAIDTILAERQKKSFVDLFDFCKRIDLRTANKRVIESLIYAGAFDTLTGNRAQKINELSPIIERALAHKKNELTGQMDLFNSKVQKAEDDQYPFEARNELSDREKLDKEKEVIGFYLSSHPLETYRQYLNWFILTPFAHLTELLTNYTGEQELFIVSCGLLKSKKEILTKKGERMAFVQLEDMHSSAEIILFPKTFAKVAPWLDTHHVFVVKGSLDLAATKGNKIKANEFIPLELVLQEWKHIKNVSLALPSLIDEAQVQALKKMLVKGNIPLSFIFHENGKKLCLNTKERIALDAEIIQQIEQLDVSISIAL
ncbi:MAG: DNA polymerase III subunit alpha [bacterium]|nr:DNA polymerase III subunit alpha [bacterium]